MLPTVRTVIRSSVAVYMTFMFLQAARFADTFVTQCTLVWFISCVDYSLLIHCVSIHAEDYYYYYSTTTNVLITTYAESVHKVVRRGNKQTKASPIYYDFSRI